jgi:class 3 adenylate cyclase
LAEFASVVNAVECAVETQTALKAENTSLPPERQMEFRIGVNLGDLMVDGGQNRLKPCRGRPFGLYGELESESQNRNPCLLRTLQITRGLR